MTMMGFGKHRGKSVELVVLKFPDYAAWMSRKKNKSGGLQEAMSLIRKLVKRFDSKPFVVKCSGQDCENLATRCSVYKDNVVDPAWWCDECNHYSYGARPGHLAVVSTYVQALNHIGEYCGGKATLHQKLIRELARAKGLPKRVGEKQAREFLKADDEWGR